MEGQEESAEVQPETVEEAIQTEQPEEQSAEPALGETEGSEGGEEAEGGEEEKEQTPEEKRMSARFAALAKREKALVAREKEVKETQEKLQNYDKNLEPYRKAYAEREKNPQAWLDLAGITLEQILQYHVNNGQSQKDPTEALKEELASFKKQLTEKEQQQQRAQVERQIQAYKNEVNQHISDNPDDYELIIAREAQDDVFSLIELHFQKTGEVLTPDSAAQKVEDFLLAESEKVLKTKKLSSRLAPKEEEPEPEEEIKETPRKKSAPKTLSSRQTVSDPITSTSRALSREERMKAAAAKLRYSVK